MRSSLVSQTRFSDTRSRAVRVRFCGQRKASAGGPARPFTRAPNRLRRRASGFFVHHEGKRLLPPRRDVSHAARDAPLVAVRGVYGAMIVALRVSRRVSTPRFPRLTPSPTTVKAACFFQRDARQRLGLCRTDVPAVVASAVALVRAPRFVDAFDRALVGPARRSRGLSVVAARASPRPSDPRETPFFPVAPAATATSGTICVFRSPRAHPSLRLSDEHAR